jgi:very-short-patch-repair endonuclease
VLRFWVTEVDENMEGVIQTILDALSFMAPHLPPPAPRGEDTTH